MTEDKAVAKLKGRHKTYIRRVKVRRHFVQHLPDEGVVLHAYPRTGEIIKDVYPNRRVVAIEQEKAYCDWLSKTCPDVSVIRADPVHVELSLDEKVAVLDIDAPDNPYPALINLLQQVRMTDPFLLCVSDMVRQQIKRRRGVFLLPDCDVMDATQDWIDAHRLWWPNHVRPFVLNLVPYRSEGVMTCHMGDWLFWGILYSSKRIREHLPQEQTVFSERRCRRICRWVAAGDSLIDVADRLNLEYKAISQFRRRDLQFAAMLDEALQVRLEKMNLQVEDSLFRAAYRGNMTAIQLWLFNRAPERWAERIGKGITSSKFVQRNTALLLGKDAAPEGLADVPTPKLLEMRQLFDELSQDEIKRKQDVLNIRGSRRIVQED